MFDTLSFRQFADLILVAVLVGLGGATIGFVIGYLGPIIWSIIGGITGFAAGYAAWIMGQVTSPPFEDGTMFL